MPALSSKLVLPWRNLFLRFANVSIAGKLLPGTTATLAQLPPSRILTLGMDTPEAWLVQPVVARYDLDNIKLEDLGDEKVLSAVFELEHVLVEGTNLLVSVLWLSHQLLRQLL